MNKTCLVIKVGGSLLTLTDLRVRLDRILQLTSNRFPLFIVGGGAMADIVREWAKTFSLPDSVSHDLAVESLNATASLLVTMWPNARRVTSRTAAERCWSRQEIPILQLEPWLNSAEGDGETLPKSWDVTSDSLAAWVALRWPAAELLLLKSVSLPDGTTLAAAQAAGAVDPCFPRFAAKLARVTWCNLRNDDLEITTLT